MGKSRKSPLAKTPTQISADAFKPSANDLKILNDNYFGTLNFSKINTSLRNGNETDDIKPIIDVIDKNMMPLSKDLTVERFVNNTYLKNVFGEDAKNLNVKAGTEKIEKAYMSTSYKKKQHPLFCRCENKNGNSHSKRHKSLIQHKKQKHSI